MTTLADKRISCELSQRRKYTRTLKSKNDSRAHNGGTNYSSKEEQDSEDVHNSIRKKGPVIKTDLSDSYCSLSFEEEDEADYKEGGYHPVQISHVYNSRYKIVSKLGWGYFSTVWLALDLKNNTKVALKIIRGASRYTKSANDEIQLLRKVSTANKKKSQFVVSLLDHFSLIGPNGLHMCLVFESLGCSLFTLIRMYEHKGVPIPLVKIFIKQILFALDYLHCYCRIIHTDLKPENILLYINPNLSLISKDHSGSCLKASTNNSDGSYESTNEHKDDIGDRDKGGGACLLHTKSRIERHVMPKNKEELLICFGNGSFRCKVVDLGNACWVHKHFTDQVQTRQYRAPEVILGCSDYNASIDIWSLACIAFELLTGDLLFTPHSSEYYNKDDDHLTQMIELLGTPPRSFVRSCRLGHHYLTRNGNPKYIHKLRYWPLRDVLIDKYKFLERDAAEICDFLLPMLEYSPLKRATAAEQLKHPWIKNIDVEDFSTAF